MTTFYSGLTKTLNDPQGMPSYADAAKWKKWLDSRQKKGDFRQAEREWSDIDDWLDKRGGAYRAEVCEYVRHREVKITPIELGGPGQTFQADPEKIAQENGYSVEFDHDDNAYVIYDVNGEIVYGDYGDLLTFSNVDDAWQEAADKCVDWLDFDEHAQDVRQENDAMYQIHVTPGDYTEYRELLMVIPPIEPELIRDWYESKRTEDDPRYNELDEYSQASLVSAYRYFNKIPGYTAPHFAHKDIVAHARLTIRNDKEGKPFVFVEEIQSDWGQTARKNGTTPVATTPFDDIQVIKQSDCQFIASHLHSEGQAYAVSEPSSVLAKYGFLFKSGLWNDYDISATYESPYLATPTWTQLVLKHVAAWAVDNGYSRIAWTPGELQAEQNNLSKRVERIDYRAYPNDEYGISIKFQGIDTQLPIAARGDAAWLENHVGKKISDLIISDSGVQQDATPEGYKSITGSNLRVGGKGITVFYDAIVKNTANKFLRGFGTSTKTMDYSFPVIHSEHALKNIFSDKALNMLRNDGNVYGHPFSALYTTLLAAREGNTLSIVLESMSADERAWLAERVNFTETEAHKINCFDINPAMRDRIVEGLPLFSIPEQVNTPISREEVFSLLLSSDIGQAVSRMLRQGTLKIHNKLETMPSNGIPAAGLADEKGNIHLCAEKLTKESAMGVLLHEAFHNKVKPLIGDHSWQVLMGRLETLYENAGSKNNADHHIWLEAVQRVSHATKQGGVLSKSDLLSEFGAYAIETVETNSKPIQNWVRSMVGRVKAWGLVHGGFQLGEVTPQQLSSLARIALKDGSSLFKNQHAPNKLLNKNRSIHPTHPVLQGFGKLCGSIHGLDVYCSPEQTGVNVTIHSGGNAENSSKFTLDQLRRFADGNKVSFAEEAVKLVEAKLTVLELSKSMKSKSVNIAPSADYSLSPSR
tara:strand:- start:3308 stop:6082 length:2775 start_codon:yes stop_codon:yes gene_type:complete